MFTIRKQTQLLKKLAKVFEQPEQSIQAPYQYLYAVNPDRTVAAISKTSRGADILKNFIPDWKLLESAQSGTNEITGKKTLFSYPCEDCGKSRYGSKILQQVFDIAYVCSDEVEVQCEKDFPITIENDDFRFYVAPIIR